MPERSVLGIVLAGGAGTRLSPLTADRAKPAVPFGGLYRLIDFALSNMANGGIRKICVLTQYKSHSLDRHISTTWRMSALLGNYVTPVPAQQRLGPHWYTGSADAIFQSMNLINDEQPDIVIVSGGLVRQSVLSPGVRVNSWATVERSVLLHNTKIGRHAVVRDAIIDKNVTVPEWAQVGVDKDRDRARGFVVSAGGITVVGKGQEVVP